MKKTIAILCGIALSALVALNASQASAQQKQPAPDRDVVFEARVQDPDAPPPPPGDFIFVNTEMNFDGKVVKGAPYSARQSLKARRCSQMEIALSESRVRQSIAIVMVVPVANRRSDQLDRSPPAAAMCRR